VIIVAGSLVIDPEERAAYLADCRRVVETARRAPGCLDFALSADMLDASRINVFERWATAEDLERFRGAGPGDAQLAVLREIRVGEYDATPRGR
jgi:quinol monooxygenase YgiN